MVSGQWPVIGYFFSSSAGKDQIVGQQHRSQCDAGVRYVEGRPVIRACVHHYEIDHKAKPHAIRQVAENSGQQQSASAQDSIIVAGRAKEIKQNCDGRGTGQYDKESAPEGAAFLQLAKGYAAVLGVNQIERARNDRAIFKSQAAHRPGLARLIH